jgi:hypothetical protein
MSEHMSMVEFIALAGLHMKVSRVDARPDTDEADEWHKTADHFLCTLNTAKRQMTVYYSKGEGLRTFTGKNIPWHLRAEIIKAGIKVGDILGNRFARRTIHENAIRKDCFVPVPPTLPEVLSSLTMDVQGVIGTLDYEEWASDYGYDGDSRKGEKIYRGIRRQASKLKAVLGASFFHTLINHVEIDA